VELGRILSGKEQADRKAASITKGSRVLTALSGSDWGWTSNLLRKMYQTSLLSGATYAGGGWLPWLSASSVNMLDRAQNRNLRVITGQLGSMPNEAQRVEAGFQSFGCLQDQAAAVALEWSLRLDPATHPRAAQAIQMLPGNLREARMEGRELRRLLAMWVDSWMLMDDSLYLLPHLPPGSGERGVGLSLYLSEVAAAQMTPQQGGLQMR
jgi:hypothetical protein